MAGLLVEVESLPSPPCLSGRYSWNQLISASLNTHCPRLMNHEAGCRTETPVFMFRPPGRQRPVEPQIWASCSNPDSPELCWGVGFLGVRAAGGHSQSLPISCGSFGQHHLWTAPKSEWRHSTFFLYYWSIVDLQCHISFRCTSEWFSIFYIYFLNVIIR